MMIAIIISFVLIAVLAIMLLVQQREIMQLRSMNKAFIISMTMVSDALHPKAKRRLQKIVHERIKHMMENGQDPDKEGLSGLPF